MSNSAGILSHHGEILSGPGGIFSKEIMSLGDFILGDYVWRDFILGGLFPGDFVQGDCGRRDSDLN